jgi:hypothetical protein
MQKIKPWLIPVLGGVAITMLAAGILYAMGRPPICTCGTIELFHWQVNTSGDSQHVFDPYSFTHVLHGIILFAALHVFARKIPLRYRFLLAISFEAGWEVLENTSLVIERYRAATFSLGYYGDSILNSIGDIISMLGGFWIASKLRLWQSIAVVCLIELLLLYLIRDNLTINLIMLAYPIEAIKQWQLQK